MKTITRICTSIILLTLAGTSCAQQTNTVQRSRQDVAEAEHQLQEARMRLEEAAREVAQLAGQHGEYFVIREFNSRRAMLGINIGGNHDDGSSDGVEVLGVTPNSPADNAGLKAGDVILKIDDESLAAESSAGSSEKLTVYLAGKEPGDTVNVEYIRGGKTESVAVVTWEMPMPAYTRFNAPFNHEGPHMNFSTTVPVPVAPGRPGVMNFILARPWGDMELAELSEGLGKYFGTDKGVLVVKAPSNETLQLQDGDVILDIGGREPNDPIHALRILQSYDAGESMELQVMRDKRKRTLEVTVPEQNWNQPRQGEGAYMIHPQGGSATIMAAPAVPLHQVQRDHNPESVRIMKRLHQPGI